MNSSFVHLPVYIILLLMTYLHHAVVGAIEVGDQICVTGYIMDIFCIDLGYLLDNPQITTLNEPENHSFHCLFDESVCYNSGFVVLGEKDFETSLHCLGLRLEESDVAWLPDVLLVVKRVAQHMSRVERVVEMHPNLYLDIKPP